MKDAQSRLTCNDLMGVRRRYFQTLRFVFGPLTAAQIPARCRGYGTPLPAFCFNFSERI
jgi:hypothetical protein